ncbi:MAG: GAF domain-containing protein [Chloroflexi bacterium]|nr:GAF domain-containing protein [Chloroflexota bacterium]
MQKAINLLIGPFRYYYASIYLISPSNQNNLVKYSASEDQENLLEQIIELKADLQSVVGRVITTGEPLIINDVSEDTLHRNNPLLPGTKTEAGFPIKIGQRVLGAIELASTQLHRLSRVNIKVLQFLADQLAVAVSNSELIEYTQQKTMNEQIVSEISTRTRETLNIDSILKTASEEIRKSLNLPEVSVRLISNTSTNSKSNHNGQKTE